MVKLAHFRNLAIQILLNLRSSKIAKSTPLDYSSYNKLSLVQWVLGHKDRVNENLTPMNLFHIVVMVNVSPTITNPFSDNTAFAP